MNTNLGVSSATTRMKRAAERFKEWAALKSYVQKQKAQKTGIQVGVSAIFGLFLLVWAEVALYLAFAASMKPYFAALLVFAVNLAIVGGVNLAVISWKRNVKRSEDRAMLTQLNGDVEGRHLIHRERAHDEKLSASDAVLRAAKNRHEARLELLTARSEFRDTASLFVNDNIVQPISRNRLPIAFSGSFFVGLLAARALLPKREKANALELIEVDSTPTSASITRDNDIRRVI